MILIIRFILFCVPFQDDDERSQENTESSFVEDRPSNTNSLIDIPNENSSTTEQSVADFETIDGMEFECVSSLL